MIKYDLFQGCKDGSSSTNQLIWYITLTQQWIKSHDHHNRHGKNIWQNSTSVHIKSLSKSWYIVNISQHKTLTHKKTVNSIFNGEKLESNVIRKRLITPIYKYLMKLKIKKKNYSKWSKNLNKHFSISSFSKFVAGRERDSFGSLGMSCTYCYIQNG